MKVPSNKLPPVGQWAGRVASLFPRGVATGERARQSPPAPLVLLLVMALGVVVADTTRPDRAPRSKALAATNVPVVGSIDVCPELLKTPVVESRLTAGTSSAGEVTVSTVALTKDAKEAQLTESGGEIGVVNGSTAAATAVVATAAGPQAGGLAVEQVSRAQSGPLRGLSSVRCEPPVANSWFIGAATTINDESLLLLINPYDDSALVNVSVYSKAGRLDVPGSTGITVGPRSRLAQQLSKWAPDEPWLAVRVEAVAGRVSPAIRRTRLVKQVPSGIDWLPRSAPPSEFVTVGALPGGAGDRTLVLVNPGRDPALVRVELARQDGQFVPVELAEVEVAAERVVAVSLTKVLEGKSASLRVESDGPPVLAGAHAEIRGETGPGIDFLVSAGMEPLSGPALTTDNRADASADTAFMFAAPDGPAELTLTQVPLIGKARTAKTKVVPIEQGKLVVIALSTAFGRGDPLPVLVTPSGNSAPVYGVRITTENNSGGTLSTSLGLQSQPLAGVPRPEVAHDAGAWLITRP